MDDADSLRNHATRLFALAEKARQKGHPDYADELTNLAREVVRHAVMIERRFLPTPHNDTNWRLLEDEFDIKLRKTCNHICAQQLALATKRTPKNTLGVHRGA